MWPAIILVHSPSVGPASWQPIADELSRRSIVASVPDLRRIGAGGPPYWPRVAEAIQASAIELQPAGPVVLVAHSNAGLFLPTVADALAEPVAAAIFVDAAIPTAGSSSPVAPIEFQQWLQGLASPDGMLPRWTDWWSDTDVEAMLPDPAIRAAIVEDQPRLPLDYYRQRLPVPASWAATRCGYLQFSAAYDAEAETARSRDWPVERLPGDHLHQVIAPGPVTDALLRLVCELAR
jgi:hypothetical protein